MKINEVPENITIKVFLKNKEIGVLKKHYLGWFIKCKELSFKVYFATRGDLIASYVGLIFSSESKIIEQDINSGYISIEINYENPTILYCIIKRPIDGVCKHIEYKKIKF